MTEWQLVGIMIYLLIGYMIADTFLVKVDQAYWATMLFYPIVIIGFILVLSCLTLAVKYYEAKDWINDNCRNWT